MKFENENLANKNLVIIWYYYRVIGEGIEVVTKIEDSGDYTLLISGDNIENELSTSVYINMLEPITIPSAFTPNGDGENETWVVTSLESYRKAEIKVYDRQGDIVFESTGAYAQDWDASIDDSKSIEVYYYEINLNENVVPAIFQGELLIVKEPSETGVQGVWVLATECQLEEGERLWLINDPLFAGCSGCR